MEAVLEEPKKQEKTILKRYTREEVYKATLDYFKGDTLAAEVWINKYCLKDSDGNLYELTPDDMHWRLANELARIEAKYENPLSAELIYDKIKHFEKIVPQGSPMAGIGNNFQTISISNCVHGESLVYTKEFGLIKMKDIKSGYHVLTHNNRFRKVLKHWFNGIKETYTITRTFGDKRPNVRNENEMGKYLAVTPEHKVYTENNEWIEVKDLLNKQNKRLKQPKLISDIKSPDLFPIGNGKHVFLNKDFAWFIGLYLAEGAIKKIGSNHPSLYLTLNVDEEDHVKDRLDNFFIEILGHKSWIQKWDNFNFIQINIFEPEFAKLINKLFGHGFDCKRLPEWIFSLDDELKREIIDGFLFGDGTNYTDIDDDYNYFAIANQTLAYELGLLCRSIGKNVRYNFLSKGKLIKNRTIGTTISTKEDKITFIKSPINVEVFDMEVEEDHSFVAGDIICHNCFVIGNDQDADSYGGIFKLDQEIAQLQKRRAGVGVDLSFIRPQGSPVKNSALTSTGVVPFMERFSNTTREVAQDGRRGALMESISIKHPDSESFIDAKMTQGKVTGANVSVRIHDDFMEAAVGNKSYTTQYPVDSDNPVFTKEINANKLWKKIVHNAWKSAEPGILFWDTIIRESIPDCYADLGFKTISTNPCFPASEYLLTKNGYVKFGKLNDEGVENTILADNRISYVDDGIEKPENWKINMDESGVIERNASNVFLTKSDAEIIELTLNSGLKLKCTPDHHIATTDGMIEAKDITPEHQILISQPNVGDSIVGLTPTSLDEIMATLIGLITGDGTFTKKNGRVHIDLWGEDKERMYEFVTNMIDTLYQNFDEKVNEKNKLYSKYMRSDIVDADKIRITSKWLAIILDKYCNFNRETKHHVPEFILRNSRTSIGKYYVAALMYCDGSIQGTKRSGFSIRLAQSNKNLLEKIQLILHSNGVMTKIYKRRDSKMTSLPDGNGGNKMYRTKTQYELITINSSIVNYCKYFGFIGDNVKESKFDTTHDYRISDSLTDTINEIKVCENEPVYCLKEDIGRNIIVNGISTRRCGEITLCANDSCRLLAINLYGYVVNPFTKDAYFDWEAFKEDAIIAERLMDDIVDLELEKVVKILTKIENDPEVEHIKNAERQLWLNIKDKATRGRRTGLGVTAEGDMLAALGLKYGTDKANDFSEEVHKVLKLEAYRSSVIMAKERGAFPMYDFRREEKNPFIQRIENEDPELYKQMIKYGRRNLALLTIAPTGSVSIMTQTSSGIECVFLVYYTRRRKINPNDKNVRVDFVDELGDTWMEYPVFHHKFETWLVANGYDVENVKLHYTNEQINELVKLSPYYGATSNDVDWVKKVEMQGRVQRHVDHSISVTVNLPNEITEEMVGKVYETGWRSKCKGITVYRDGSRSGVLISETDKKKKEKENLFKDNHAPKRPKRLKGEIIRFQNNLEKWIAVVGLLDGRPYEIFTGKLENGLSELPTNITECEIVKNKYDDGTKRYDIEYVDVNGEKKVHTGLNHTFNPEFWNYAKLISSVLRHGMPMVYVLNLIQSLNLNDEHLNTWKNGVARVIKRYFQDGEKGNGKCPSCGSENLEYKEGCLTCVSCGNSKCG